MDEFKLTKSTIADLLEDPEFYRRCHAWLFLQEQGLAAVAAYKKAVAEKEAGCDGCNQPYKDETTYIAGVVDAFVRITVKLAEIGKEALQPLREFICYKLGYRPDHIVLYYKQKGKKSVIVF